MAGACERRGICRFDIRKRKSRGTGKKLLLILGFFVFDKKEMEVLYCLWKEKLFSKGGFAMRAVESLPAGYREIYSVNLQKNKKIAIVLNVIALIIAAVMIVPMNAFVPISSLFSMENGIINYLIRFFVFIASMIAYICLHELIHGITMKAFGTKQVKYGFTGLYAFAGSEDYYDKKSYIIIALAPVVVFLFVLAVINVLVPLEWFWVVYFLQILNVSGAAGDLFVTFKFSQMPKDILVQDSGVGMTVYSAS